jgi:hypothetical protein
MSDSSKPGDDGRPTFNRMNDDLAENSALRSDAQKSPLQFLFAIIFCLIFGWFAYKKLNPEIPPPAASQIKAQAELYNETQKLFKSTETTFTPPRKAGRKTAGPW